MGKWCEGRARTGEVDETAARHPILSSILFCFSVIFPTAKHVHRPIIVKDPQSTSHIQHVELSPLGNLSVALERTLNCNEYVPGCVQTKRYVINSFVITLI